MGKGEKVAKGETTRKRAGVTRVVHHFIMSGFDEAEDFKEFVKSAIKRE